MFISDIVIYINPNKDLIYSYEQTLIDSMNSIKIDNYADNNDNDYHYHIYDNDNHINEVNLKYNLESIVNHKNNTYIKVVNEYSSYFLGKVIHGYINHICTPNTVTVKGYQKIDDDGYYIYINL